MEWLQIIVLALVQGITEFLPISSSAHLILVAELGSWPDQGLAFDVAVHLGTLAAVCLYFRNDLLTYLQSTLGAVSGRGADDGFVEMLKVGAASLPVAVAGLLFKDDVEGAWRTLTTIASTTIIFGIVLGLADRLRGEREALSWLDASLIGAAQMLALIPGTSRSGITITAALFLGLSRTRAARFSFLLSIPTIAGAAPGIEHLQLPGHDLRAVTLLPVLLPAGGAQAAFDVDLGAFLQVFARNLRQPREADDVVPLRALLLFTGLAIAPRFAGRDAEVGDRVAPLGVAGFRVSTQIADEYDFVDAPSHVQSFQGPLRGHLSFLTSLRSQLSLFPRRRIPGARCQAVPTLPRTPVKAFAAAPIYCIGSSHVREIHPRRARYRPAIPSADVPCQ